MSRTIINFLIDLGLLLLFMVLMWTTLVLRFIFPRGTAADGWTLWGLGYDDFAAINFNVFAFFVLLIVLHVMFHWSWVCGVITQRLSKRLGRPVRLDDGNQTLYGVSLLIGIFAVLGALTAAAALSVQWPA